MKGLQGNISPNYADMFVMNLWFFLDEFNFIDLYNTFKIPNLDTNCIFCKLTYFRTKETYFQPFLEAEEGVETVLVPGEE